MDFVNILNKSGEDHENFIKAYDLFANYIDDETYDYYVKNWGTENTKETETGRAIIKEYGTDENGKEDKEDFEIKLEVVYV